MIANIFIGLCIIALIHFIYEGIVLPSIRFSLRNKLFELRDQLRYLKIVHSESISLELFEYLDGAFSNTIKFLPRLDFRLLFDARKLFARDSGLFEEVAHKMRLLEECKLSEVNVLSVSMFKIVGRAFIFNNLMLICALAPIAFVVGSFQWRSVERESKQIVSVPEEKIVDLAPDVRLA